ncbi:MAG: MFS transporter [Candidatus Levyibacteriota bacterium]
MILKYFPVFKYRDFRLLWFSELVSRIGTTMVTVAISWHLYLLTHSPFALGLIGLFQLIPFLFFNLFGGVFADAHDRRKILRFTQPLFALASLVLGISTVFHFVSPFLIYLMIAIVAVGLAFDMPARNALLPSLIDKKDLSNANSVYGILEDFTEMIGPAVGGFLIAFIGLANIYFLDAISTVFVFFAILAMHTSGIPTGEKATISFKAVIESVQYLFSKKLLWSTKLLDGLSVLFASCIILMPVFAKDVLHVGPTGLGFLYAAPAVGAVLTGLVMSRVSSKIKKQGKLLLLVVAIYALATIAFGLSTSFPLSLLFLAILGAANCVSVVIRATIRQLHTPSHMMGRLYALFSFIWVSGDKLGDLEAGILAGFIGAPFAVIIGGAAALTVVGTVAATIPELRNFTLEKDTI